MLNHTLDINADPRVDPTLRHLEVNLADQTVYPESFRMHNDTLNMSLGSLLPVPPDLWCECVRKPKQLRDADTQNLRFEIGG